MKVTTNGRLAIIAFVDLADGRHRQWGMEIDPRDGVEAYAKVIEKLRRDFDLNEGDPWPDQLQTDEPMFDGIVPEGEMKNFISGRVRVG